MARCTSRLALATSARSVSLTAQRVAAEIIGMPWEKVELTWGNTSKNLPWSCNSGGSQTTHAMTRAAYAAGMDGKRKLQEIAAKTHGGRPEDYEVGGERVYHKGGASSMTLAEGREARHCNGRHVRWPHPSYRHQQDDGSISKSLAAGPSGRCQR